MGQPGTRVAPPPHLGHLPVYFLTIVPPLALLALLALIIPGPFRAIRAGPLGAARRVGLLLVLLPLRLLPATPSSRTSTESLLSSSPASVFNTVPRCSKHTSRSSSWRFTTSPVTGWAPETESKAGQSSRARKRRSHAIVDAKTVPEVKRTPWSLSIRGYQRMRSLA